MPTRKGVWLGVLILSSLTRQAFAFADDDARRAILDLRGQVQALTQRVNELEYQLENQLKVVQSSQVTLLDKMSQFDERQRQVTGRVEENANRIQIVERDQNKLYDNVDQRLARLEPVEVSINGETVLVNAPEHQAYQRLETLMTQGRRDEARPLLDAFQKAYPQSVYSAQVFYWQASMAYERGEYRDSIDFSNNLIRVNPRSVLVPDAMLLVSSSQAALNNLRAAKATLDKLIERYPDTPQAATAQARLKLFKKVK